MRACGVKSMADMGFDRDVILGGAGYVASNVLTYNYPVKVTEDIARELLRSAYDDYR